MSVNTDTKVIGNLTKQVIDEFNLKLNLGQPILLGESNLIHMEKEHPEDFKKYKDKIEEIINSPDYIAKHPKKDSIEYIKVFKNKDDEFVLVAVRASGSGTLFARTLFVMDPEKVDRYVRKDALKPYKK